MLNRIRWILATALFLTLGAGMPVAAQAAECTDRYSECLNDSYDKKGFFLVMADIECFGEYVGCVGRKIIAG